MSTDISLYTDCYFLNAVKRLKVENNCMVLSRPSKTQLWARFRLRASSNPCSAHPTCDGPVGKRRSLHGDLSEHMVLWPQSSGDPDSVLSLSAVPSFYLRHPEQERWSSEPRHTQGTRTRAGRGVACVHLCARRSHSHFPDEELQGGGMEW